MHDNKLTNVKFISYPILHFILLTVSAYLNSRFTNALPCLYHLPTLVLQHTMLVPWWCLLSALTRQRLKPLFTCSVQFCDPSERAMGVALQCTWRLDA